MSLIFYNFINEEFRIVLTVVNSKCFKNYTNFHYTATVIYWKLYWTVFFVGAMILKPIK